MNDPAGTYEDRRVSDPPARGMRGMFATWPNTLAVLVPAVVVVLLVVVLSLERRVHDLEVRGPAGVNCAVLHAQAVAPRYPGAARDAGSLTVATTARTAYADAGCDEAGFGDVPDPVTGER